jgi:hypothetical protein
MTGISSRLGSSAQFLGHPVAAVLAKGGSRSRARAKGDCCLVLESRGHVGPIPAETARTAQQLAADPDVKALADVKHAGPGRGKKTVDIINRFNGTAASYLVRRLKRDAPDIAEALANGEYKSARSAGIAAGIVKVPTPLEAAMKAVKKLNAAEIKLRAERKCGELLAKMEKKSNQHGAGNAMLPALAESGISKMQSHRWQAEAATGFRSPPRSPA